MNKQLLARIKAIFQEKLMKKTGWGRNDIMAEYNDAVNEAIMEMMDAPTTKTE